MNFVVIDLNDPRVQPYLCQHGALEHHIRVHNVEAWRDPRGNLVLVNLNGIAGIPDIHLKAFTNA